MSTNTIVYTNGSVYTMDASLPRVEAFAVADGTITAVGEDATALLGQGAERHDLNGKTVLPGLVDIHIHHAQGGRHELFDFNVSPGATLSQVIEAIAAAIPSLPDGSWLTGGAVGSGIIAQIDTPEALARLDAVSAGHPVLLTDDSLHNRWANSLAMQLGGITSSTTDPEGGSIMRDAAGRPTGWLVEAAGMKLERAKERIQPFPMEQLMQSSARGVAECHAYGITAFQDAATSWQTMQAVHALDMKEQLNAWVVSSTPVEEFIFGFEPVGQAVIDVMGQTASTHHRPNFVKIFLDGVPPTRTAAFLSPYNSSPATDTCSYGHMTMDESELLDWLLKTAEQGIGAKIHCTGDASVHAVLDAVEQVRAAGFHEVLYQVAHGQFVAERDLARFGELNVSADISPAIWFPGVISSSFEEVLGEPRASQVQPNRLLLERGARIAVGSDWPVAVSPNPWPAIYGLVTRQDPTGTYDGALWPEQSMTIQEALTAYTLASAEACGIADVTGSLEVGKSADFIVLPINPFDCPVDDLITLLPEATYFAGQKVYEKAMAKSQVAM